MQEPRMQYVRTEDGVSIAYHVIGEGEPAIINLPPDFSHIALQWQDPGLRERIERRIKKRDDAGMQRRMTIWYDRRGMGSSDREVDDFSLDAQVADLDAVISALGLSRVALVAGMNSTPEAMTYAARYPSRVSHLVLWCPYLRGSDLETPRGPALRGLISTDWKAFTEFVGRQAYDWHNEERGRTLSWYIRQTVEPDALIKMFKAREEIDVTPILQDIHAPTLVLQRRRLKREGCNVAREVASKIPNAYVVWLEGSDPEPPADGGVSDQAVEDLLEGGQASTRELSSGMTAILFTDIANSTALTEQFGDAAFRDRARQLDEALLPAIADAGGSIVDGKLLGDGILATFRSARQAIDAATRCRDASGESGLALHLGIHAGDVIREEGNVFGGAVNLAARIADASEPGEILVSDTLRGLARTSAGVAFDDRGEHELKGIAEPQRLFAVRDGAE